MAYSRSQGTTVGRTRTPSNPTSPGPYSGHDSGSFSPISIGSPSFGATHSRPHSRAQSQPQSYFNSLDGFAMRHRSVSPDDYDQGFYHRNGQPTGLLSPPPSDQSEISFDDEERHRGRISSLPIPSLRGHLDDDDDSDGDDPTLGRVHERYPTSSTVSMELEERIDALQKVNDDLRRRLSDTEETLQRRLAEREAEIDDMQQKVEELKSELSSTKRTEKELKAKDVRATHV